MDLGFFLIFFYHGTNVGGGNGANHQNWKPNRKLFPDHLPSILHGAPMGARFFHSGPSLPSSLPLLAHMPQIHGLF
jgi:hypothetical protein